ncbi:uncharacterized protein TRUGW13939_07191 [Talaromyces rugulosus]|uniref:Enhancer of polycomb-like protein n=1 Tax=Talaromyces rugulosus TaxID=121627 RepID=A0A7H8R140_TALRU|nr:uncharacterized protein TRUGW13939_07191 [Talaromyces rugulosus]QKX60049.1 hypothetical protein TRUGW13939_07191 [Talaromyces rugulosus]
MTRYGGMGRTRPKKLTSKASIPIVREDQIDYLDEDIHATLQQIETGVEKAEESEVHLQAAINAAALGKVSEANIPTPETILSNIQYDELYPPTFSQPATYIRFSSTVEDCCGCPYDLVEEDDVFLKIMNEKKDPEARCTENQFEEVMHFFEETAQTKQPFAAVDNPPVISFEEIEESFDAAVEEHIKIFAKEIYDHWKRRRIEAGNRPLQLALKFETGQETDDGDPYVCFRRREVRQIRKTRGRDAQSAEKLRRLRKELEEARQLVGFVRSREVARREMLKNERQIFQQRAQVKDMKRKLNIKDDDEDLINQKPKKKQAEMPSVQRPAAPQLRVSTRPGSNVADDLQLLEDVQADKENEILRDIKQNLQKHIKWNEGYVDLTTAPLSTSPKRTFEAAFRPAITTQLPTPPSSDSSEPNDSTVDALHPYFRERFAEMYVEDNTNKMPSFRRRIGRGGRVMIDRRNLTTRVSPDVDPLKMDRFKYDDEDDDDVIFERDKYDVQVMQHRVVMAAKARDLAAQVQAQAQAQAQAAQAARQLLGERNGAQGAAMGANSGPSAVTANSAA